MKPATLEHVTEKLRELAERRRQHVYDLYRSGRWKHYYTDREFIEVMRAALEDDAHVAKAARLPPAA